MKKSKLLIVNVPQEITQTNEEEFLPNPGVFPAETSKDADARIREREDYTPNPLFCPHDGSKIKTVKSEPDEVEEPLYPNPEQIKEGAEE